MTSARRHHMLYNFPGEIQLTSDFDVTGPYFTCPSTIEMFLHSIVTRTVLAFSQFGFGVRALLCDGASTNLSLLKLPYVDTVMNWMILNQGFLHPLMEKRFS